MISEKDEDTYKFSIRSNAWANVAELASRFGGGGHAKAAGFTRKGPLAALKKDFLMEAGRLLNETSR
jgi:phosphoesterase RecJ-like protein